MELPFLFSLPSFLIGGVLGAVVGLIHYQQKYRVSINKASGLLRDVLKQLPSQREAVEVVYIDGAWWRKVEEWLKESNQVC